MSGHDFRLPGYDPDMDFSKLEETPEAFPEINPTGNVAFCYTCGIDLRKLSDDLAKRKYYSDHPSFFITLCVWCDHDFRRQS